jgi:glycosyltransferase involved in cell wall biosynthesis/radical SAM superfamily enzyme YgiQ (UPF0313 family)
MNVLLTTSAAPREAPFSTTEKRTPLGIGFLISVLRNRRHKVYFIDNYLQPSDFLQTDYLTRNQIDFVGIYVNTICYRDTKRMLETLEHLRHTSKWNGKIIVGGPHTTVAVHTIPDFVDYVVQGEGEQAIVDIVEGKVRNRIVRYPRIENLDELPPPAWDYFANLPYNWSVPWFEQGPVFTMNTSRGCPFNCAFCSVQSVWGKKYTCFSAERIVSDIEHLIKNYGVKGIYFREDNFTLNKERVGKFCNLIMEKGIKINWVCESRVSNLTRDIVELMSRAGLKGFYFGVESGSQRLLDLLQKGITVEQTKSAFKWCHEFNVKAAASVIVGVPGETESDRQKTSELLKEIKPDVVWTNIFVGIPDSSLYRFVLNNRLYQYIDDRGLLYLQGHNSKVKRYYGSNSKAYMPDDEPKKDMTTSPKISVLMAVYNGEKFIEQALKSIHSQTCQDFELIIVDDASTDKTSDILVKMKDSRTFIYRNSENKGLTKSLNIGLKLCRGEYVARMDADDISLPRRFEKQVKFLDENPNCIAVGCWCGRIDSNGKVWGDWKPPTKYEDIKKQFLVGNSIPHGTAMVRRSALIKIGGYDERYKYSQDYDLWLRLSELGELRNLGEYLYTLRTWPGAITKTRKEQQDKYAELARQEALHRKNIQKSKMIPETSPVENIDERDSKGALDYFLDAREEFNRANFETATKHIQKYKRLMDYSKLPRTSRSSNKSDNISVSVILVTYNRNRDLVDCLGSLSKQDSSDYEVIVVDNGQSDVEVFKQYVDQYIKCPINFNLSEGRNIGAHFAGGRIIVFLDDDALVGSNYISSIKSAFENFDIFGLRGRAYPKTSPDANNHINVYDLGDKPFPSYCNQEGNSAFLLEVYKKMQGMDPLLFGHEGSDLTYRIIKEYKLPNKIIYWPWAVIYHDYGIGDKFNQKKKRYLQNVNYLKYKHNTDIFINRRSIEKYPIDLKQKKNWPNKLCLDRATPPFQGKPAARVPTAAASHPQPKVSIIIPCYNSERFLPACLDSIRNQTMRQWELFLLDDASTDGTKSVIERYCRTDERIKPYYFQDNKGPYVRRNCAIEQANSDFIVIQDADDIACPAKLEILYNEITKDAQLGIVGSFYWMFLIEFKGLKYTDKIGFPLTHDEIIEQYRSRRDFCWHGSAIIRKELFEAIGLYDENLFSSDSFWLAKAAVYASHGGNIKLKNIPEFLTLKRAHPISQTGVLPTFDQRSRRAKFHIYWRYKLSEVIEKLHNNPNVDIKAELGNCKCNDYIERYGHLFEQWESEPLNGEMLNMLISIVVGLFNNRRYVSCIVRLEGMEIMARNIAKRFKNYDLLRAIAYFAIDMKHQSLKYLNKEIQNHKNPAARQFISDYFENHLKTDVYSWCLENGRFYDLRIIDLEDESGTEQRSCAVSDRHTPARRRTQVEARRNLSCGQKEPLVTVIMPVYNGANYIGEAIESVLIQNYPKLELVIVDDGSTDNTKEVVSRYKDERIKYIYKENGGPSSARNYAIRKAEGQYIMPLDSDDMMAPNFITLHLQEFEKYPETDLVYCDVLLIDGDGNPIKVMNKPEYQDRRHLIKDLFRQGHPVIPFRLGIRKRVFDKIGLYDETLMIGEDYDMMRRFVKAGLKAHHLKGTLHLRRVQSNSLSRNFTAENAKYLFEILKRFVDTFTYDELFPDVDWNKIPSEMRKLHAKCLTALTYLAIGGAYVKSNAPAYARTAFEQACLQLKDCLKTDPGNWKVRQLLQKCEVGKQRYDEKTHQAVC